MDGAALHERLWTQDRPFGAEARTLVLGSRTIRIEGMDATLAAQLETRWGAFLTRSQDGPPRATVRLFRSGPEGWLAAPEPGEIYRIEAINELPQRVVASYHFAIGVGPGQGDWRAAVTDPADERLDRIVDNVLRFVTVHTITEDGGFAMHAAGVARDGLAWLFAGPSGAGKSTAVGLSAPVTSLGDDLGLVMPADEGWVAPALPFDNSERIEHEPPRREIPVAGVWRLYQSEATRVEDPPHGLAVASLMGCVAFPWALPEFAGDLLERVERFVSTGRFHHLHFEKSADIWAHLLPSR